MFGLLLSDSVIGLQVGIVQLSGAMAMIRGAGTSQRSHAGAKVEPLEHQSLRMMREGPDAIRVTDDSVVVPVPLQLAPEGGDDLGERDKKYVRRFI